MARPGSWSDEYRHEVEGETGQAICVRGVVFVGCGISMRRAGPKMFKQLNGELGTTSNLDM